jgi:hypothetical protein
MLAWHCTSGKMRGQLKRDCPRLIIHNWADDGEAIFLFKPEDFELIAQYARPRRKRQVSETQRQRIIENTSKYRFRTEIKSTSEAQNRGQLSLDDQMVKQTHETQEGAKNDNQI